MAKKDKVQAAGTEPDPVTTEATTKETKSIVPPKYAGKYKGGGQGPLSDFIRSTCGEGDKFSFTAFFDLCRKNGLPDDKVAIYEGEVSEKKRGAEGRARMTLGNSLRAIARKNQKLVNLNGEEVEVAEPAIKASGAVAAAQAAKAAEAETQPAE